MAELYRQKVTTLAQALEAAETRTEAREALRGLIENSLDAAVRGLNARHLVTRDQAAAGQKCKNDCNESEFMVSDTSSAHLSLCLPELINVSRRN